MTIHIFRMAAKLDLHAQMEESVKDEAYFQIREDK